MAQPGGRAVCGWKPQQRSYRKHWEKEREKRGVGRRAVGPPRSWAPGNLLLWGPAEQNGSLRPSSLFALLLYLWRYRRGQWNCLYPEEVSCAAGQGPDLLPRPSVGAWKGGRERSLGVFSIRQPQGAGWHALPGPTVSTAQLPIIWMYIL